MWRAANIALAFAVTAVVTYRLRLHWNHWTGRERLVLMALASFAVATMTTSAEAAAHHFTFGLRIPLMTVANLWALWALSTPPSRLNRKE